jgi:hypothetical protein
MNILIIGGTSLVGPHVIVDMIAFTTRNAKTLVSACVKTNMRARLVALSSIDDYRVYGRLNKPRLPAIYGWPDTTRVAHYLEQMRDGETVILMPQDNATFRFSRCLHKNAAFAVALAVGALANGAVGSGDLRSHRGRLMPKTQGNSSKSQLMPSTKTLAIMKNTL